MITREEVLANIKYLGSEESFSDGGRPRAIRRLCEFIKQDLNPDPDAALWEEINELLEKLNAYDPVAGWKLVRGADPMVWQITTRERNSLGGWTIREMNSYDEPSAIRDQLHELATERGLLTPSLEEMQAIAKDMAGNGQGFGTLYKQQVVKLNTFLAALAAKGGG